MKPEPRNNRVSFPWVALIVLLLSVFIFWILPLLLGPRKVQVEFEKPKASQKP